jgi:hypothetical protein
VVLALTIGWLSPAAGQPFNDTFTALREALFDGLANQVGTLPNPSGGGFTYTFDPSLGIFSRTTESFGPVFANRAETTGRRKLTLNASFSYYTFNEVDGVNLKNGDMTSLFADFAFLSSGEPVVLFDFVSVREEVKTELVTLGLLYGVTDRIDVGITIPILNVKVKERPTEDGFVVCDVLVTVCGPFVATGQAFKSASAENTGLGDIVLRGKWNFLQVPQVLGGRMGMAFALDVKLPTGDEGDRQAFTDPDRFAQDVNILLADITGQQFTLGDPPLGTGIVRVRPQIIWSGSWSSPWGTFAPHANVGAELGTTTGITNDLVYEVGLDYTFLQRATLSVDLLGRHAFDVKRDRVQPSYVRGDPPLVLPLNPETANPDNFTLSLGLKVNPWRTLLVFVNVLVTLDNTGLRDDITPTFGVEWTF